MEQLSTKSEMSTTSTELFRKRVPSELDSQLLLNSEKFDISEGLIFRRPSYEAIGQNELSRSRHRLRGATLPALLRRLTSLEVSTRDDAWAFLTRSRALISPVHLIAFLSARFFIDTYRPGSKVEPYFVLNRKKAANGTRTSIVGGKVGEKVNKVGEKVNKKKKQLLDAAKSMLKNNQKKTEEKEKIPKSSNGETLWLLTRAHVLGPSEDCSRSAAEWQSLVELPVRCAVLSLLDVYLAHWGFDFNNSIAGGSVGKENEAMRTEAATALKHFLIDVSESGSLALWGWQENSIFGSPEVHCPALFAQFPALAGAICAAVAADKSSKSAAHKLTLSIHQLAQVNKALRRNPSFLGQSSNLSAKDGAAATDAARAAALAIAPTTLSALAGQAACVIAAEHRLAIEAFDQAMPPPKKLLTGTVDKILLAVATNEIQEEDESTRDDDGDGNGSGSNGDKLNMPLPARLFDASQVPPPLLPPPPQNSDIRIASPGRHRPSSGGGPDSGGGAPAQSSDSYAQMLKRGDSARIEISIQEAVAGNIRNVTPPRDAPPEQQQSATDFEPPKPPTLLTTKSSPGFIQSTPGSRQDSTLSSTSSSDLEPKSQSTRSVREGSTGKKTKPSLLSSMLGQKKKESPAGTKATSSFLASPSPSLSSTSSSSTAKRKASLTLYGFGISLFGAAAVSRQLTLHLHYLYATIPLREFTLDLSYKHSKNSLETHGQPHLARFRNESERIPLFIISTILECPTVAQRGKLLSFFVELCDHLHESRSLHALMLVLSALQSNPIHRLKKSWASAYNMFYQAPSERTIDGNPKVKLVKDAYSSLLALAGIGGRQLPNVLLKVLTAGSSTSPHLGEPHRISFPVPPHSPSMPFVNASLGTLIRLNELPDEAEVTALLDCDGNLRQNVFADEPGGKATTASTQPRNASSACEDGKRGSAEDSGQSLNILNLSKMRRCASIFATLRMCQLVPYAFEPNVDIQYELLKPFVYCDPDAQYARSKELEPPETSVSA